MRGKKKGSRLARLCCLLAVVLICPLATIAQNPSAAGRNEYGQLGDGTETASNVPVAVYSLTGVTAVSAGIYYTLALKNDGTVRAWGNNTSGQLGNETNIDSNVPVQASGLTGVTAIAAGGYHSIALKIGGTVWTWGFNYSGQLGNATNADTNVPVQVSDLTGVTAIAGGGAHCLALKGDGTVWAWGINTAGQLGDGTNTNSNVPVGVKNLTGVSAISAGHYHSLALKGDGTVWAWGANSYGQLGDGTDTWSNVPVQVSGLTGVTAIAAGGYHGLAIKGDGTAWAWGHGSYGQLGDGHNAFASTPVEVSSLTGVTAVAGGVEHSLAITSDGKAWGWGYNYDGMLGCGTNSNSNMPLQVVNLTGATSIAGGYGHSVFASCPAISLEPPSLPAGTTGVAYSQAITASGGTAPYTYALSSGALPDGLALNAGGLLSGTPKVEGVFPLTIRATDASGCTGRQEYSLPILCPPITLSPSTLPSGTVGAAYSQTITASGGTAPYSHAVASGAIPTGLTLGSNGALSGTPTASGGFNFTVRATDANGCTGSRSYGITISCPTLTLSPTSLPGGTVGTAYSQTITASGGTAPYTYAVTGGTLPTGLALGSGGTLSGTPTAAGSYSFTAEATDLKGCPGSRSYSLSITCPTITLTPSTLPNGMVGTPYEQTISASGGESPYTFVMSGLSLPNGLAMSTDGHLSGTPTQAGMFTFSVIATDGYHCMGGRSYSLTIGAIYRVLYSSSPMLAVTSDQGQSANLEWDATHCASADYHIIYGKGEGLPGWQVDGGVCALGTGGRYQWEGIPDPSTYTSRLLWWLVVGNDGGTMEGSWGLTSDGAERGGAAPSRVCKMDQKNTAAVCAME